MGSTLPHPKSPIVIVVVVIVVLAVVVAVVVVVLAVPLIASGRIGLDDDTFSIHSQAAVCQTFNSTPSGHRRGGALPNKRFRTFATVTA